MFECVNFMAGRGHEVHALAHDWDDAGLAPEVVRHQLTYPTTPKALALPRYRRAARHCLSTVDPPPEVVAGFGAGAPAGSVVWMQSVHAEWIEIARRSRDAAGRLRQRLNPFHLVALRMERHQLVNRDYAKIIALTPDVKSDIVRHYGVPEDDIEIIPNGYSASEFFPASRERRAKMRARLGYQPEDRVVVFVANELERKGFGPLLAAIGQLGDHRVRVLAVGRLRESEARADIALAGLGDRVTFVGSSNRVADFYAAADVFALPTKYEAWGLVILEAMACGLPVLTTSLAGASVAVRPGVNGRLVHDPGGADRMAEALRALLEGQHGSRDEIASSVAGYEWSRLLVAYERILYEHRS